MSNEPGIRRPSPADNRSGTRNQPAKNQEKTDHHGFVIAKNVTSANCRNCHETEYQQFLRSRHAERQGKSPRELMTGQGHPHWLTLLGLGPLQPQQA